MAQLSPLPPYDEAADSDDQSAPAGPVALQLTAAAEQLATDVRKLADGITWAAERFASSAGQAVEDAARRAEESAAASREMAGQAGRSAEDVTRQRQSLEFEVGAARDEIERAAAQARESIAAELRRVSEESQEWHEAQRQATTQGSSDWGEARAVLDRLEADYQLLSQLVVDLHNRITDLTEATGPQEALWEQADASAETGATDAATDTVAWRPVVVESVPAEASEAAADSDEIESERGASPESQTATASHFYASSAPGPVAEVAGGGEDGSGWAEATTDVTAYLYTQPEHAPAAEAQPSSWSMGETASAEPALGAYGAPVVVPDDADPAVLAWPGSDKTAELPRAQEDGLVLEGRVMLNVEPVPDFDRLLSLDGALSRIDAVRNVTLADYAKEEVTFRMEMSEPIGVGNFTLELCQNTGRTLDVVEAAPGSLHLRFVAAE